MNDSDTVDVVRDSLTTAKDSLVGVHVNTPLDAIVSNGRARRRQRRQRRLAGLTGAAAVTAGMALAVTALASSGHPASQSGHLASHPPVARLAAWTVAKQANGDIDIDIRQLKNPAGLQSTLRADGVPVNVRFNGQSLKGTCQFYPMSDNVLNAVAEAPSASSEGGALFVINPSALPVGAGLALTVGATVTRFGTGFRVAFTPPVPVPSSLPPGTGVGVGTSGGIGPTVNGRIPLPKPLQSLSITPVYASQQCTG
jgi:hypothetical protein